MPRRARWWMLTGALVVLASTSCRTGGRSTEPGSDSTAELQELYELYSEARGDPVRLEPVEARLLQILEDDPEDSKALLLLANVQLERGKPGDALVTANRCVAVSADVAACWLTIAVLEEQRGSSGPALEAYRQYVALTPEGRYAADARVAIQRLEASAGAGTRTVRISARIESAESTRQGAKTEINRRLPQLQRCYNEALVSRHGLAGKMTFTLTIAGTGEVTAVDVIEDTVASLHVTSCAREAITQWDLGPQGSLGSATFSVVFSSKSAC